MSKVQGVGRIADNPRAILVGFSDVPTDDQLRSFHDFVRPWQPGDLRCDDCDNGIREDWKFCAWCGSIAQEDI